MKYVVETRLTYDHGGNVGMHCDYPLGLFNNIDMDSRRVEISHGRYPILLQLNFRPGWGILYDVSGQPMTKFRQPETVAPYYDEHEFYFDGKLYILEIRLDWMGK